jgi:hypothetical protein
MKRPAANSPSAIKPDDRITWEEDNSLKRKAIL